MPRVLIADDNSNVQKMVSLALKDAGIEVIAVGNGEAAVRKMPETIPDLVLADIFMPVRNGYEVCEFVKRDPRFMHIPVVLLVGAFDPLDEREALRVHADGVLKKPFVPPDPLIAMVTGLLAKIAGERLAAAPPPAPEAVVEPPAPTPTSKTSKPVPEAPAAQYQEAPLEEFAPRAAVTFADEPNPLAYASLLETPTSSTDQTDPIVTATRDPILGEPAFWTRPPAAAEPESTGDNDDALTDGHGWDESMPPRAESPLLRTIEADRSATNSIDYERRAMEFDQAAAPPVPTFEAINVAPINVSEPTNVVEPTPAFEPVNEFSSAPAMPAIESTPALESATSFEATKTFESSFSSAPVLEPPSEVASSPAVERVPDLISAPDGVESHPSWSETPVETPIAADDATPVSSPALAIEAAESTYTNSTFTESKVSAVEPDLAPATEPIAEPDFAKALERVAVSLPEIQAHLSQPPATDSRAPEQHSQLESAVAEAGVGTLPEAVLSASPEAVTAPLEHHAEAAPVAEVPAIETPIADFNAPEAAIPAQPADVPVEASAFNSVAEPKPAPAPSAAPAASSNADWKSRPSIELLAVDEDFPSAVESWKPAASRFTWQHAELARAAVVESIKAAAEAETASLSQSDPQSNGKSELRSDAHSEPIPESSSASLAPTSVAPIATEPAPQHQEPLASAGSSASSPAANSEAMEAVIARVMARMQPQMIEIVTREILRPVVEALVRGEFDKK